MELEEIKHHTELLEAECKSVQEELDYQDLLLQQEKQVHQNQGVSSTKQDEQSKIWILNSLHNINRRSFCPFLISEVVV